jgi:hypothetical protein
MQKIKMKLLSGDFKYFSIKNCSREVHAATEAMMAYASAEGSEGGLHHLLETLLACW